MASILTRIASILTFLGGLVALTGFLLLPFGMNPIYLTLGTGLQVLQARSRYLTGTTFDGKTTILASPSTLLTYGSLWSLLILSAIIVLLALVWTLLTKPGKRLPFVSPLLCLILSLAAGICLFLGFYDYTSDGDNLFSLMFTFKNSLFLPIIGSGWWVCAAGLFLSLIASIFGLALRGSNSSSPSTFPRESTNIKQS
jgi:hypothetical protein